MSYILRLSALSAFICGLFNQPRSRGTVSSSCFAHALFEREVHTHIAKAYRCRLDDPRIAAQALCPDPEYVDAATRKRTSVELKRRLLLAIFGAG